VADKTVAAIAWGRDFEAAMKDSAGADRHVLIDFTAAPM
jgi:hypothetical protein